MAVPTFTLTGDLSTYTNAELAGGYGSIIVRGTPSALPLPAEAKVLVQPDAVPVASDGTFTVTLAAVEGVRYSVSTSPRTLFKARTFDAPAAGTTLDLSELIIVTASTPTTAYLIGRGVPPGGTTGQVAAKASGADYDVEWVDQTGGGGGGAVASVNGKTGAVVLAASDVGAQPVGSYATAAQGAKADTASQPGHTHTASQVSDSTTVGRALLTAADAATARGAIGAGTSTFSGAYTDLTGKPTLGTAAATASSDYATAAQGVKADSASQPGHTHTLDQTTDTATRLALTPAERTKLAATSGTNTGDQTLPTWSTIAGKPAFVAEGTTAANARTAIGAGTSSFDGVYASLTSKPTLGDAAAKNTGTSAGTLAAGDDSRFTDPQYAVNTVATSGSTQTLAATFAAHKVTLSANCTFTFSAPTKVGHTFVLYLSGAFTPTFPASVKWDGGAAPTYTSPALYTFTTLDTGTMWIGSQVAKAIA